MASSSLESQIEALLFATGEPVKIDQLSKFFKIKSDQCSKAIDSLMSRYEQFQAGITIIRKGDQVQLVSAKEHGAIVASFLNKQLSEDLSTAAAEVLAVVAYRGPITRAGIEQIRGVSCSFTLRNLAMRGLIERRENPHDSRSFLYEVSFDFLKSMAIPSIESLPEYEHLHTTEFPQPLSETVIPTTETETTSSASVSETIPPGDD